MRNLSSIRSPLLTGALFLAGQLKQLSQFTAKIYGVLSDVLYICQMYISIRHTSCRSRLKNLSVHHNNYLYLKNSLLKVDTHFLSTTVFHLFNLSVPLSEKHTFKRIHKGYGMKSASATFASVSAFSKRKSNSFHFLTHKI